MPGKRVIYRDMHKNTHPDDCLYSIKLKIYFPLYNWLFIRHSYSPIEVVPRISLTATT